MATHAIGQEQKGWQSRLLNRFWPSYDAVCRALVVRNGRPVLDLPVVVVCVCYAFR